MKFKTNFTDRIYNLNPSICFYDKDNVLVDSSHRARLDEHGNLILIIGEKTKLKIKYFRIFYCQILPDSNKTIKMETLL